MPEVSASELARLRSFSQAWLTEDAELRRVTQVPDTKGGYANSRATIWTGKVNRKPSTENQGAATETATGDMLTAMSYWLFTFPAGVDVHQEDEILAAGRTYLVTSGLDKSIEIARYVIAEEQAVGS